MFSVSTLKLLLNVSDIGQFWQYIVCTAELAYVPVRIIGTLEWVNLQLDIFLKTRVYVLDTPLAPKVASELEKNINAIYEEPLVTFVRGFTGFRFRF